MAFRFEETSRRVWARVAGLTYLLVLAADLTGMQISASALGRTLMLAGSLLTVPLALGLYFALRVVHIGTARVALVCRLVEAALGVVSTVAGFQGVAAALAITPLGRATLGVAFWNGATSFGAFLFTVGSTLFFWLFVKSRSIPPALSWLGFAASLIALGACTTHLVLPGFPAMTIAGWVLMLLAEISVGVWLLVWSVKPYQLESEISEEQVLAPISR